MPHIRSRNACLLVSDFDKGSIVAYWDCSLFYHRIAARVGRDPMPVKKEYGTNSHIMSPESRIRVVSKTTNVCMNSSTTCASTWTLSTETMAILDAASQTGTSSIM
ncbi:hypothetical protein TNCV_4971241 [Trichonephila clavipes]|nr:hypothetical protein TNCV_4971241 [Trichonephila clavipes]